MSIGRAVAAEPTGNKLYVLAVRELFSNERYVGFVVVAVQNDVAVRSVMSL
ncbi:hypothetical protein D3C87_1361880 [compost metagenome]